jgi:diguanylate cyclase (GGDEF)-like protein
LLFNKLIKFFVLPTDKPELVLAQLRAFSRQIPLLYLTLLVNMVFVSATHWKTAPFWLVGFVPCLFATVAIGRVVGWWRARDISHTLEQARKRLHSTIILVSVFSVLLTTWSLALLRYGDMVQQGHVAFFMAATLVASVFCLTHLRPAAVLLATLVTIPFSIQFALMDNPVMWAMAANLLMMAGTTLYMLFIHYDDFENMIAKRTDLERRNEEMRLLNAENHRLANLDALTSLPNRRSFIASIKAGIAASRANGSAFAVGLIDLDGFKAVNDLYGHAAGDALLIEASQRLNSLAHDNLMFARLGGDEFGFIASPITSLDQTGMLICEILGEPYDHGGVSAKVTASCGISFSQGETTTETQLLEHADYALYQAKHEAPGTALIFNSKHHDQLRLIMQMDQALRNAKLEDELRLVYQPVVDCTTGQIIGVEALARWSSEKLGPVSPHKFITTAERSPMIHKVTSVLLKHLLTDMAAFPPSLRVSFNLSAKSLCTPQSMLQILAMIQRSNIAPNRLEFEVTESALMGNFEIALQSLHLLRNLGATIALDDFGTGYSSLSHVHELPLDKLKIDRSFVVKAERDERACNIVKTIVNLSHNLNLDCVAEGVETEEQVAMLQDIGCSRMQGFYFAKPMTVSDLVKHLSKCKPATKALAS